MALQDNATFIPAHGDVLAAAPGTKTPTASEIQAWIDGGATGKLGAFESIGHTSLDELPGMESEQEGGEAKGSWQNPTLRTTPIKITESIVVTGIQWTEEQLSYRFGKGRIDTGSGVFEAPDIYTATERSLLVVARDGSNFVAFHYARVTSRPEGSLEFSAEDFLGMPIRYDVLKASGKPKLSIVSNVFADANPLPEEPTDA